MQRKHVKNIKKATTGIKKLVLCAELESKAQNKTFWFKSILDKSSQTQIMTSKVA